MDINTKDSFAINSKSFYSFLDFYFDGNLHPAVDGFDILKVSAEFFIKLICFEVHDIIDSFISSSQ